MKTDKEKVVGIGEVLWDVFPDKQKLGGAPANFAYHASQFGFEGYIVSAVGQDELGRNAMKALAGKQLKPFIEIVDFPTGTVMVTLDEKGKPQYEICGNVAWDNIPMTREMEQLARTCKAVCFGSLAQRNSLSRATISRFLELVPEDSYKIFDINVRQYYYSKQIIHESLSKCNVFKVSDEEVPEVAKLYNLSNLSEEEICRYLLKEYKLEIVVETKGEIGSYIFTTDETFYMDTPKVAVLDTVGAGDSFTGAFIASLLSGKTIREAHHKAVEIAAYVCTQQGAMPLIPSEMILG